MKRSLFALLSLVVLPSFAHAAVPKTVKGQIAANVRKIPAAKGLKFNAKNIQTRYLNGKVGGFTFGAYKARPGLPSTEYTIGGDFNAKKGPAKISDVKIELNHIQPL